MSFCCMACIAVPIRMAVPGICIIAPGCAMPPGIRIAVVGGCIPFMRIAVPGGIIPTGAAVVPRLTWTPSTCVGISAQTLMMHHSGAFVPGATASAASI